MIGEHKTTESVYICKQCQLDFKTEKNLKEHYDYWNEAGKYYLGKWYKEL